MTDYGTYLTCSKTNPTKDAACLRAIPTSLAAIVRAQTEGAIEIITE